MGSLHFDGVSDRFGSRSDGAVDGGLRPDWSTRGSPGCGQCLADLAFQPKANSTFSQSTLDAATIRSLGRQPGIQAESLGLTFFNAKDAAGTSLSIAVVGIEPGDFVAKGVAGGSQLDRTRSGVIVSREVAADGVRVGGRSA